MIDYNYSKLQFHIDRLFEIFLLSRKTPSSLDEILEIKKISLSLSVLSWLSQSQIFHKDEEAKIIEDIKELCEDFHESELNERIKAVIQKLKNINESLRLKAQIFEHFSELEFRGCLDLRAKYPLDQSRLNEKFNKIALQIKENFSGEKTIDLMKLEREVKEIKQNYIRGIFREAEVEQLFNSLINKGKLTNP